MHCPQRQEVGNSEGRQDRGPSPQTLLPPAPLPPAAPGGQCDWLQVPEKKKKGQLEQDNYLLSLPK